MGFKFRKSRRSIKILPGVRLNTGKKGINSVSIGGRGKGLFGATTNINLKTGKTKTTYRIKGIGSFEHTPDAPKKRSNAAGSIKPSFNRPAPPPPPPSQKSLPKADVMPASGSQRWYETNWFAILSTIIFPPLGIVAIWSTKWSKRWKIASSVVAGIWMLILYVDGSPQSPPQPMTTSPEVEQVAKAPIEETANEDAQTLSPVTTSWEKVFQEAERLSETAQGLSENALSPDDWALVASRLERSIQLYGSIPDGDPYYQAAQQALEGLNRQLIYAQKGQPIPDDPFPTAINAAMEAANLTQTAQLSSEWEAVAAKWQESIELLELVPEDSPNAPTAQAKITEYGKNLQYAQAQATAPPPQPVVSNQPTVARAREPRSGSCDCPYDYTSSGSRCGDRSAYSRPGGRSPVCYVQAD